MRLIVLALVATGCTNIYWQAKFVPPGRVGQLALDAPFLKCHTADGRVYVLENWTYDRDARTVTGRGLLYSANRALVKTEFMTVPVSDVVLFETNDPRAVVNWARVGVMALATAAQLVGTIICLANVKACFGSCPTFYVDDGEGDRLMAEGFSASIAHVLEATDVDALYGARPRGRALRIEMANEALETHFVRSVRVLAAPRPQDGRVLRAGSDYFAARAFHAPARCQGPDGADCRPETVAYDGHEWRSFSDGKDLAAKETIELAFHDVARARQVGLVIGARNTLLNTFLLYQTLAYMGHEAAAWFTRLETGGRAAIEAASGPGRLLGDIEVEVWDGEAWKPAGVFSEVGPLAREVQLIPLSPVDVDGALRVRLRLTRANWRIDYLALAELGERVVPTAIEVEAVERAGTVDRAALENLRNGSYLVTTPGDRYTLTFALPAGPQELFLESRGYYYEWMREAWLAEEDPRALARMLLDPASALRDLAPAYQARERDMERVFWSSRVGRVK